MAEVKKPPQNQTMLLLTLGSLIGFLVGFVLLLANLPGINDVRGFSAADDNFRDSGSSYEFFTMLPGLKVDRVEREAGSYVPEEPQFRSNGVYESAALPDPVVEEIPASYQAESYYLQAGSFLHKTDAEKMRAKLLLNNLDAFVKPVEHDGRTLHRVRLGPYYEKSDLDVARAALKERGIDYMVLRVRP
ncbi:SPOR domain-containing protein [Granulosicoccaceae sp. 1_MG-2023]|nr:SPOR domain-containing protein [Granulosicoccaceae sp. 1_MG-2023]